MDVDESAIKDDEVCFLYFRVCTDHSFINASRLKEEDQLESPKASSKKRNKWKVAEGYLTQKRQEMDKAKASGVHSKINLLSNLYDRWPMLSSAIRIYLVRRTYLDISLI